MKASSGSNRGARSAALGPAVRNVEQPFTNLRFLVAIDGVASARAVEVVFPTARIVTLPRKRRAVQFDSLVVRRGLTLATDWYGWWDQARRSTRDQRRNVQVILLDSTGAVARRWIFPDSVPLSYSLSPLNALAGAAVIESLELRVGDFELYEAE